MIKQFWEYLVSLFTLADTRVKKDKDGFINDVKDSMHDPEVEDK